MTFKEVLAQVLEWLQHDQRISYRALKRHFALDDDALEDLKEALLYAHAQVIVDDGRGLVWMGDPGPVSTTGSSSLGPPQQAPLAYTPPYLAEKILTSRSALEGERKQVTVLFADLKGSMELLADRDPEEARQLLDPVLERMMAAVHRYEGTVNQVMGDGIMALFGAPVAHEDHAVRACYAALAMQDAIRRYARRGAPHPWRRGADPRRAQLRRSGGARHRQRPAHGLLGRRPDDAPGGTHGAAGHAGDAFVSPPPPCGWSRAWCRSPRWGRCRSRGWIEPVEVFELVGPAPSRTRLQAAVQRVG